MPSPFSIPNIRRFIAFRVLFNSRFYYPVFTILFLDFGLTVAQFSILNAAWAATIVLAEVPSGALADIVGRKRLMVFAAGTMVVEIAIISILPTRNPGLVFWVFLLNRVLSGLAEAAASGADEAIAYDSLTAAGMAGRWGEVLERTMRLQSVGFIIAMSLGAAVYDPFLLNRLSSLAGIGLDLTPEQTMRFPLYLTLILACLAWLTTLRMTDPVREPDGRDDPLPGISAAFGMTVRAGRWICRTPFALTIILFGMMFDGIIRMVITLSSQYYRMILLPESIFGILGSLVAILGVIIPKAARIIAENKPPATALWLTAGLTLTGLLSMSLFLPYWGILPAMVTFAAMTFTGFFVSYYINRITPSDRRATVLSFKGLAYNISYGILGILYALLLKAQTGPVHSGEIENRVFMDTFIWFPLSFAGWFVLLTAICVILPSPPETPRR